jgi:sugar-specific transcriptional regulator TrmB
MSTHEAVEALRELGLSNYEARVFVALQRLGSGTAQEVSQVSDVPRSQVYGAADDLAARGLLEVVESSPKAFRPVDLSTARDQLTETTTRTAGPSRRSAGPGRSASEWPISSPTPPNRWSSSAPTRRS